MFDSGKVCSNVIYPAFDGLYKKPAKGSVT